MHFIGTFLNYSTDKSNNLLKIKQTEIIINLEILM